MWAPCVPYKSREMADVGSHALAASVCVGCRQIINVGFLSMEYLRISNAHGAHMFSVYVRVFFFQMGPVGRAFGISAVHASRRYPHAPWC